MAKPSRSGTVGAGAGLLHSASRAALVALAVALPAPGLARADFLYGVNDGPGQLVRIDPATGKGTLIGDDPNTDGYEDIERVNGKYYVEGFDYKHPPFVGHHDFLQVNPTNGQATYIGSSTNFSFVEGLANVNGVLYGSASQIATSYCADCSDHLVIVDPATGHTTDVGKFGASFLNVEDIAYSPIFGLVGVDLGTLDNNDFTKYHTMPAFIHIDPNAADKNNLATKIADLPVDGSLVKIPSTAPLSPLGPYLAGLDFTPDGKTLYASTIPTHFGGPSNLVKVDPTTGAITTIGPIGFNLIDGIKYVAVPEPASVVLVSLGGLALLAPATLRRLRGNPRSRS